MTTLPPVPHPIGIFNQFIARQSETLILKEKVLSITGDSFEIKLANGTPIFKVTGKVLSISGRKRFTDIKGNHLFDICKEHFHIHSTYVCKDPQDQKIFECKSSFKLIGSKATGTFKSTQTGREETLIMKGNFLDSRAEIVCENTGVVVASINRKLLSGKDIFFGQQTYAVTVAPGVDMALMAAMCICLDEKNNEPK